MSDRIFEKYIEEHTEDRKFPKFRYLVSLHEGTHAPDEDLSSLICAVKEERHFESVLRRSTSRCNSRPIQKKNQSNSLKNLFETSIFAFKFAFVVKVSFSTSRNSKDILEN